MGRRRGDQNLLRRQAGEAKRRQARATHEFKAKRQAKRRQERASPEFKAKPQQGRATSEFKAKRRQDHDMEGPKRADVARPC